MKSIVMAGVVLIACVFQAVSQDQDAGAGLSKDAFEAISIRGASETVFSIKNGLKPKELNGNVDLLFIAENPSENLSILADRIEFQYSSESDSRPNVIRVTGLKKMNIPGDKESAIKSDSAEIHLESNSAEFTGNVVITLPDGSTATTPSVTIDMNTGEARVKDLEAEHIPWPKDDEKP